MSDIRFHLFNGDHAPLLMKSPLELLIVHSYITGIQDENRVAVDKKRHGLGNPPRLTADGSGCLSDSGRGRLKL